MPFKKDPGENLRAAKISGGGALYYSTWTDGRGDRYVRIEENVGGGPNNGTFSSNLFRLDEIGSSTPRGYRLTDGVATESADKNMSAFLRAIAADIDRRAKLKEADQSANPAT